MTTTRNEYGTTISSTLVGERTNEDGFAHYLWTVTLTKGLVTREIPFMMGLGHVQTRCGQPIPHARYHRLPCTHVRCFNAGPVPAPPDLYDVLTSLKADATNGASFIDWCGDLGYDTDSVKARETYFACQQSEVASRAFFGADWPLIQEDEDYI